MSAEDKHQELVDLHGISVSQLTSCMFLSWTFNLFFPCLILCVNASGCTG